MKGYCFAISLLSSFTAIAGDMGAKSQEPAFGEASFSVGYFNGHQGKSQHINIEGLIGNDLTVDKNSDSNYLLGLGYLINGRDNSRFNLAYGIKAFYLAETDVRGRIFQEGLFDNLSYRYSLTHIPVYAIARTIITPGSQNYGLSLDAGIGPNFMKTKHYSEASLDGGITIPDHAFSGHTSTEFSATAGIGIRMNNLAYVTSAELGYRFFYLGQGNLQARTSQIFNQLKTGNCYANALVLTVNI